MSYIENGRYYTDIDDPILPSECGERWLQYIHPIGNYRQSFFTGKWMIFADGPTIDALWVKLKERIDDLGISMKSSTHGIHEAEGLICVYTKDYHDKEDVRRVLKILREIDITGPIYYKADEQTRYRFSGSLYYSPYGDMIEVTAKGKQWLSSEYEKRTQEKERLRLTSLQ